MAGWHDRRDLAEVEFVKLVDEALRVANPNPTRQGCPSHDVLVALARRERPIDDPVYEHLLDLLAVLHRGAGSAAGTTPEDEHPASDVEGGQGEQPGLSRRCSHSGGGYHVPCGVQLRVVAGSER